MRRAIPLLLLLAAEPAWAVAPGDSVLALAADELVAPAPGFGDGALVEFVQRAMITALGADAALTEPLPPGARLARGPLRAATLAALGAPGSIVRRVRLDGAAIAALIERNAARFAPYSYEADRPLLAPGEADSAVDTWDGVGYEIDLTRPAGERVRLWSLGGAPFDPARTIAVAVTERRLARGDLPAPEAEAVPLAAALEAHARRTVTLRAVHDHNAAILPDYAFGPGRAAIDRLVRHGIVPAGEVHRLHADLPARRGDGAYWLARAFGWRERRLSGAFPDLPDSLEPWVDGLVRRDVLGDLGRSEFFDPFRALDWPLLAAWCEAAARAARAGPRDPSAWPAWRRDLASGTAVADRDTFDLAALLGVIANLRLPTVRVLATADFHGALEPSDAESPARPGAAALAARIESLRAANPAGSLLLDAGDLFQGSLVSNLAFGRPVVELFDHLGLTAAAVGNHEFDWSADTLAARAGQARFAFLAANLRAGARRPTWARDDTTVTRRGVTIGVLGLCYPGTPGVTLESRVRGFAFEDDSAAAVAGVARLRRAGAEIAIGLGHVPGAGEDAAFHGDLARLARGVPGVDLWLGGHSHDRARAELAGTAAVIPASHGREVAVCDLVMDAVTRRVVERRARLEPVAGAAPDSTVAALVARWREPVARHAAVVLGRNLRRLGRDRDGESAVASLVADALRAAAGTEIALQNNGGVRADLPAGEITAGHVFEVLPFENTIWTMELTGAEIRRAIEEGLAAGRVLQVSGLRYTFDPSRPPFARVLTLETPGGAPLDETRSHTVACNDFLASGGNDYRTLAGGARRRDTGAALREAVEAYIRRRAADGALDYRADGRVAATGVAAPR